MNLNKKINEALKEDDNLFKPRRLDRMQIITKQDEVINEVSQKVKDYFKNIKDERIKTKIDFSENSKTTWIDIKWKSVNKELTFLVYGEPTGFLVFVNGKGVLKQNFNTKNPVNEIFEKIIFYYEKYKIKDEEWD